MRKLNWKFVSGLVLFSLGVCVYTSIFFKIFKTSTASISPRAPFSPVSPSPFKKYNISACAIVADDAPYIVEWIEFLRLQGVEHFVLYPVFLPHDEATMKSFQDISLLPSFYSERKMADLVELIPATQIVKEVRKKVGNMTKWNKELDEFFQRTVYYHCASHLSNRTEWIYFGDVDQFIYAPKYDSVWKFLSSNEAKGVNSFYVDAQICGSNGNFWDFHTTLQTEPVSGKISLTYDPRDSSEYRFKHYMDESGLPQNLQQIRLGRFEKTESQISKMKSSGWNSWTFLTKKLREDFPLNDSIPVISPSSRIRQYGLPVLPTYDELLRDWVKFYPLATDEFRYCVPMNHEKVIRQMFPHCFDSIERRLERRDEDCALPFIQKRKTIIRGGTLGQACEPVDGEWVCPPEHANQFRVANINTQLRIDYFKYRSAMKGSYSAPLWKRTEPALEALIPQVEMRFYSQEDNSLISQWSSRVRDRISMLLPIPQYFDYDLVDVKSQWNVEATKPHSKCNPIMLYGKKQAMCPKGSPNVHASADYGSFLPFYACAKLGRGELTPCPGYPYTPCCDYAPHIRQ